MVKFPIIKEKFMKMCGRIAVLRSAMKAMAKKLKTKFSVWDQRMRRCGNLANEHSLTRWEFKTNVESTKCQFLNFPLLFLTPNYDY